MIRLDKVYKDNFNYLIKVMPLLTKTPEEFRRDRLIPKNKQKLPSIVLETSMRPEYGWAIRNLLQDEIYETIAELYQDFSYYYSIATIKEAQEYLRIGLAYSAKKRIEDSINKPLIFENDKDFQALRLYWSDIHKNFELIQAYFEKKNNQVESNVSNSQLIKFYDMTLEEFIKKTRCDVYTEKVGYYEHYQHSVKTYFIYIDNNNQVVRDKNDGKNPKYKKIFRSADSQITKRMAWEYLKEQQMKEVYDYELLKNKLLDLDVGDDESITVLWGVKIGEIDAYEELITDKKDRIEAAKRWAILNNFDRLRVACYQKNELPDFLKTI